MKVPDTTSVQEQVAAFEAELSRAAQPREAQAVRDRYLGRKNSVVASWMQLIGSAPPAQKKELGRLANELRADARNRLCAFWRVRRDGFAHFVERMCSRRDELAILESRRENVVQHRVHERDIGARQRLQMNVCARRELDDLLVAQVDPVETAHGHGGAAVSLGQILPTANDPDALHAPV